MLDAARAVFREKGFEGATVDDIIDKIGGSRGTLYIYFGSKRALFETIVREDAERFSTTLSDMAVSGNSGWQLEESAQRVFDLATGQEAIALVRTVISEGRQHREIAMIYRSVSSQIHMTTRKLFRTSDRFASLEAADRLADLFFAVVVTQVQVALLTGTAEISKIVGRSEQVAKQLNSLMQILPQSSKREAAAE